MATRPAAYGYVFDGLQSRWLGLTGAARLPVWSIASGDDGTIGARAPRPDGCGHERLRTVAGDFELDRANRIMHIAGVEDADALVHPGLWPVAATIAHWDGGVTLHAGAFRRPGGDEAWGVIADRGGGKSTLLAGLARTGVEVLTDDTLVVRDGDCMAGPRCIDLRPEAAAVIGLDGSPSVPVREGSRRRLPLDPCVAGRRLAGFLELAWGEGPAAVPVTLADRFAILGRQSRVTWLDPPLSHIADLAALPMLRILRPRRWTDRRDPVGSVLRELDAFQR